MKRFSSTGTLGAMIYPFQEKKNQQNHSFEYSTEFQAMLDNLENEECTEESSRNGEKKRRLSLNQVRALEKVFEEDNKLEAEKKVKVAKELGLEPRQVAIWFQNQRARWKKKRLERDYGVLKASYEDLKLRFDEVEKVKEGLVAEVNELKSKLGEDYTKSNHFAQEATLLLESNNNISEHRFRPKLKQTNPSDEIPENGNLLDITDHGFSERNCTLLLNEENGLNSHLLKPLPTPSSEIYEGCPPKYSPWMSCFQLLESRAKGYQNHLVKVEEQNTLFSTEAFHQQYFLRR